MKVITNSAVLITQEEQIVIPKVEKAARTCFQSEMSANFDDSCKFVLGLLRNGHMTPFEHVTASAWISTSLQASHQLVRHRLASINQKSTRYTSGELEVILPYCVSEELLGEYKNRWDVDTKLIKTHARKSDAIWLIAMFEISSSIEKLRKDSNNKNDFISSLYPKATATQLFITANIREWLHILKLRTDKHAHPEIRNIAQNILSQFNEKIPTIFNKEVLDAYSIM